MEKLRSVLKNKKGVAGLDLALSVISLIFVIGLLVMIYALMGSELQGTTNVAQELDGTATNEVLTTVAETGEDFTNAGLPAVVCEGVSAVTNTTDGAVISSGNYTQTDCNIAFASGGDINFNNTNWNVTYAFTYGGTTWQIINDTNTALADTPDWFPIVIVITFMVVLILLTVMIIRAIRGSGMLIEGGA